jgi:hypothetical protein
MKDLIIEQIERRARVEYGGDVNKTAAEYFRDHPEEWKRYKDEVTGVNKRTGEDREKVNAEVHYRMETIAYRDKLDLDKPAKSSLRIRDCISVTKPQTPCALARFR